MHNNTTLILKEKKKMLGPTYIPFGYSQVSTFLSLIMSNVQVLNHSSELGCNIAESIFGDYQQGVDHLFGVLFVEIQS